MESILQFTRQLIKSSINKGDAVVDATVGQGYDTVLLSELTGNTGIIYGFDIQAAALTKAQRRLLEWSAQQTSPASPELRWIQKSHEYMLNEIPAELHGTIAAIMFNLGYLPGEDHHITTQSNSTLAALDASAKLLRQGGLITVVIYTGHDGALAEAQAVENWATRLPQKSFQVLRYQFLNQMNHPPYLIAIQKI